MNPISRGVRNAFRNKMRTTSIIVILGLSMGLALSMLIANKAVTEKIASVKASVGNTISISPAGFSGFSSVNNSLTVSQLSKVKTLPHVSSLTESLTDRLTTIGSTSPSFGFDRSGSNSTNNQTSLNSPVTISADKGQGRLFISGGGGLPTNFSPPISIVGTNNPLSLNSSSLNISSGSSINGSTDSNDALVSEQMATKNNLKPGSTFSAYSTNLTVKGIFKTSNQGAENSVIVSLPAEQRLTSQAGDVTNATAVVDSLDNLASTTSSVKNTLGSSADVVSSVDQANQAVQPLNSVKNVSLYSLIGAIIAGGVIILLTMVMIVRERTREIGVIKAIGGSNLKVVSQFMSESVTLTLMGAVIGIVLGVVAANPITHALVTNSTTSPGGGGPGFVMSASSGGGGGGGGPRFISGGRGLGVFRNNISNIHAAVGWSILIYGFLAALIIAIIGSAAVSIFISKIRPAEVLRSE